MRMKRTDLIAETLLKISFSILLCLICLTTTNAQTNQSQDQPLDNPTQTITACEQWISRLGEALNKWDKNKDASFIVIARLGDGEYSRQISLKRIKTLKEYISSFETKVKAVFAEGERAKGDGGTIEIYVEEKLIDALRVRPKSDIPLRRCNP